jgi:hypothetical protein
LYGGGISKLNSTCDELTSVTSANKSLPTECSKKLTMKTGRESQSKNGPWEKKAMAELQLHT